MEDSERIKTLEDEVAALRKQVADLDPKPSEGILKIDEGRRMVFGWSYVAINPDGTQVVDHSGDVVDSTRVAKMEDAAYRYVLNSRQGDQMHDGKPVATLVENILFTPEKVQKMGIPPGWAPSAWWSGYKVHDEDVWNRVVSGELSMFSVGGRGQRTKILGA